jgi:hypothetical protein
MTYERWLAAVAEGVDEDREAAEPGVFARLREIFPGGFARRDGSARAGRPGPPRTDREIASVA